MKTKTQSIDESVPVETSVEQSNIPATVPVLAQFARKRTITYALKSWKTTDRIYIKPESPMTVADGKPKDDMQPPTLLKGVDLETGEPIQIVVPTVLKSELEKAFPNETYVGVLLEIHKTKVESKRYSTFEIFELE